MEDFPLRYARRTLLASLVISSMGMTVLFPVLAPLGRQIGLEPFQITSIIAASSLTVFLVTPIWGRMSDRWGRKRVMLIGLFGFAAGTSLFNSVLWLGMTGLLTGMLLYVSLIVSRVMHATVFSATMPASNAYMADITNVATRTKGMAASGAASNIGSIMGPTLTGLAVISMLMPMWVVAIAACFNGLFVWRYLPEPPKQWEMGYRGRRMKYTDRRIMPFVVVGVTMFMGFAIVQQTMGFRFQDVLGLSSSETARVFGIAMMASAGASLLSQTFIVQRFDIAPFSLLKLAIPLMIVAFTMMATLETRWMLTIAMTIQGFGMGLAGPGFMAGASLAVSSEEQGAVAGVAGSCPPLGFTLGPLIGGALYQMNPMYPYVFAAAAYVILLLSMQWLGRRVTVHVEQPPEG